MVTWMIWNVIVFIAAATALLGSPGPAIAVLLAVGRAEGWSRGLPLYWGLQLGLGLAASLCAAGLVSAMLEAPIAAAALTIIAATYLLWLAWSIATAPVGKADAHPLAPAGASFRRGLILGLTNPKAYLAFVSLMASFKILETDEVNDAVLKVALCILVMIIVDLAWLWIGTALGRLVLSPSGERTMNVLMGATILVAAAFALL